MRVLSALAILASLGLLLGACASRSGLPLPGDDTSTDDGDAAGDAVAPDTADATAAPDTADVSPGDTAPADAGDTSPPPDTSSPPPDTVEPPADTVEPPEDMVEPPPDPCAAIPGASYAALPLASPPSDRPPPEHADLNISLRGWSVTGGTLGLVDLNGDTDPGAPELFTLFTDDRVPAFTTNYRVNNWDWGCNCRGTPITESEVSMAGFAVAPGEVLEVPASAYTVAAPDYEAYVLFVDDDSITLKYTAEDNVVWGYTVHVEGICVEPSLRALYDASDAAGRGQLPVLEAHQPFGRARTTEVQVVIRDTGAFMDPRSRKDWW